MKSIVRLNGVVLRILFCCIMIIPMQRTILTHSSSSAPARRERRSKTRAGSINDLHVGSFFLIRTSDHVLHNGTCTMGRARQARTKLRSYPRGSSQISISRGVPRLRSRLPAIRLGTRREFSPGGPREIESRRVEKPPVISSLETYYICPFCPSQSV